MLWKNKINNRKNILRNLLILFFLLAPAITFAATDVGLSFGAITGLSSTDPRIIIAGLIRVALGFLGLLAVCMIIYGGWIYMTSEGDPSKTEDALTIIKNAVIGLIIIVSAFAIASFIINALNDANGGGGTTYNSGGRGRPGGGVGALGDGIVKSVYPEPGQTEVPRNTSLVVTFRERMLGNTICETVDANGICAGGRIKKENVRIFQTSQTDSCVDSGGTVTGCANNVILVNVWSRDNTTFVFTPNAYLGSATENLWYSVFLSTALKKADGTDAFKSLDHGYTWSFETSNIIDLTPPQILSNGVFPVPDNQKDLAITSSQSAQARGSLTINSLPQIYSPAIVAAPQAQGNSPVATLQGNYNCTGDGTILASINSNQEVVVSGPVGVVSGQATANGQAALGCGLRLILATGDFSPGNSWSIVVKSEKQADTLTVGNAIYSFAATTATTNQIQIGSGTTVAAKITATVINIAAKLNSGSEVSAVRSTNTITITASVAGVAGNNINLQSSNSSAIHIDQAMGGGQDRIENVTINDKKDQPRNAVIQINFNEAINPLTLSGSSDELQNYIKIVNNSTSAKDSGQACVADADCKSFSCLNNICNGNNNYLAGHFAISNQYKTVEFISNNECGVNACGEKVYCLPENSNLRIDIKAASLADCGADSCASRSPFNSCANGVCVDTQGKKYPLSMMPLNGAADLALNSLDGNRDGLAYGPISYYNENNSNLANGDNFRWSFFINDRLDLTAPKITLTNASNGQSNVPLYQNISINFDKLMMSSSLSTGAIVINDGRENVTHKLINIWNFSQQPIGYWITKENVLLNGAPDKTTAVINHTAFGDATRYESQVGSGVKDIYQNCFKPCDGPACSGESAAAPSCCDGTTSDCDGIKKICGQ
jgi:hypothetical protein